MVMLAIMLQYGYSTTQKQMLIFASLALTMHMTRKLLIKTIIFTIVIMIRVLLITFIMILIFV